jgi:hypothetical protein
MAVKADKLCLKLFNFCLCLCEKERGLHDAQ